MTPKEQYEARRAARRKEQAAREFYARDSEKDAAEFLDIADRCVTAMERIAEALEARQP